MSTPPAPSVAPRPAGRFDLAGTVRRARRAAGMSVRAMAAASEVPASVLGRAETGERSLRVDQLLAVLAVAGFGLLVVDAEGVVQEPMRQDAVRDRAGRRLPAHVDVRPADEVQPIQEWRRDRPLPWFRHRRAAAVQDADHPAAGPRDSPADRAADRRREASERHRREHALREATLALLISRGLAEPEPEPDPLAGCTCPPGCTDLLESDDVDGQLDPHVPGCPCGCDIH